MHVIELAWPVVAAFLFYLAHIGLGFGLQRAARLQNEPDFGLLGVWGLAFSTVLGGVLNLCGLISPLLMRLLLAAGFALFILYLSGRCKARAGAPWRENFRDKLFLALCLIALALAVYKLLLAGVMRFNGHDDFYAYLVYPVQMLKTGSLGLEPFSERSLMEYGGQSFLQAMFLGLVPLKSIYAMDLGGAWLAFLGLILCHGTRRKVDGRAVLAVVIILHIVKLPVVNVSSVGTALAFFYGFLRSFTFLADEGTGKRILYLALVSAGLCTLKNSLIPPWGVYLTVLFLAAGPGNLAKRVTEYAGTLGLIGVFLAPWMIHQYLSGGTLFYPILGPGFHGSTFSDFPPAACGEFTGYFIKATLVFMATSPMYVSGMLLALALPLWAGGDRREAATGKYVYFAAMVCAFLLLVAGDVYTERYVFPAVVTPLVYMVLASLSPERRSARAVFLSAMVLGVLLGTNYYSFVYNVNQNIRWLAFAKWDQSVGQGDLALREAQSAVPVGEAILARVTRPFDLDFTRNRILLIDWPGGACPPPGISVTGTAEELAEGLRKQSVRYVMYSYADEAGFSRERFSSRLSNDVGMRGRESTVTEYTFLFQDKLLELAQLYPKLMDDGRNFILDISRAAP